VFFNAKSGRLFCADVVSQAAYLHFTDWPNTHLDDPLGDHFRSLDQLAGMGEGKVTRATARAFGI
jgi:hypothetical protein